MTLRIISATLDAEIGGLWFEVSPGKQLASPQSQQKTWAWWRLGLSSQLHRSDK
jgi:hypothetical protein